MILRVSSALIAGVLAFAATPADAFCVYNRISDYRGDGRIAVELLDGGSWRADIAPGGGECCSWEDARCNNSGRREGMLRVSVASWQASADRPRPCLVEAEAGGWLYVTVARMPGASGSDGNRRPATMLRCREVRYKR